ncbi:restriction endonuclease subunit S [Lactobacillus sp. ESL0259]|uniref:restriction endonuclease subunit S n=1 Tax=Lactobacillus sp. ESL0259 TaxID=2069346 RepID=UPI000EFC550A|nr:restriction endonuclease subunit S [Lactobacillus sp. ESL0259]RMC62293.1 restriction endonuclease subunit S [Lactobacillus sp. ESL0259]
MKKPELVNLENICTKIIDCPHSTPNWLEKGIPIIRNYNLVNGHVNTQNLSYVDKKTYLERIKRAKPEQGDIVISREAPMGAAGMIPPNFNCCLGQRVVLLKLDKEKVDPYYFLYAFQSFLVQKQISQINKTGSIVSNLNIKDLRKLKIPIIDLKKQEIIVKLLKKIDSKITNNNAISKELASMAKTIYDYWFLQFEFPDKDGKPYKSNGGKMIWNDQLKQEIPEGWEVKKLSQIESNIITGKTPSTKSKDNFGKDVPFICIGDIRRHCFIENTQLSLSKKGAESQKNKYLQKDSLCVSCIATPGLVGFCNYISQTNQQINSIVFDNKINKYFLYFNISEYFKNTKGTKSGNTFANMNKQEFSSISVIYNEYIVKKFYDRVDSYFEKIKLCEKENQQLKSLRDFLLPLLMNGQVKIKG